MNPLSVYQPHQIYNYKWELHISLDLSRGDVLLNSIHCWLRARNVHPSHTLRMWASSESLQTRPCWVNYFSVRWGKKGWNMWVRVGAGNREESWFISVLWFSAKGFFVPLVTVQDKHCERRFEEKAGTDWIVWNGSAGSDIWALTPPWLHIHGDAATVHVLQSWKTFLLLPSALGITAASLNEQNIPGFTTPPKKRGPPLCVHI